MQCANLPCVTTRQGEPEGLLEPLPVEKHLREILTMDFITSLLKSDEFGTIMVVVEKFSKYATFMATRDDGTAKKDARLFFKNLKKYWGLPRHIISDCDRALPGTFGKSCSRYAARIFTSSQVSTHRQTAKPNAQTPYSSAIEGIMLVRIRRIGTNSYTGRNFPIICREVSLMGANHLSW